MSRQELEAAASPRIHSSGMNSAQRHIRLLADCAIRTHFEEGQMIFREGETANRFYLIEQGEVVLEAAGVGDEKFYRDCRPGGFARLVMALPPYTPAFQRPCDQAHERDFFLRHGPARVLRKGSLARLRAFQAHE